MNQQERLAAAEQGRWRPLPLIRDARYRWLLIIAAVVYLLLALISIDVNWARVAEGLSRGMNFIAAFASPDFTSRGGDILDGLIESLTMTLTSTVIGILLAIPVGIVSARHAISLRCLSICSVAPSSPSRAPFRR